MPRRLQLHPALQPVALGQDGLLRRDQALALGVTRPAIDHRLSTGQWQVVLPSIYLLGSGAPTRRQQLVAATLFAGPESAIDDLDACRFYGLQHLPASGPAVHVAVPWGSPARSRHFVVVRRTTRPIRSISTDLLRFVEPAVAAIDATRRMKDVRTAVALLTEVVQRRLATYDDVLAAHLKGSPRGARLTAAALEPLAAGVRSAPEADVRRLFQSSRVLPEPLYNCLLQLADGHVVSPDALFVDAGLVHETNGRAAHARHDLFEEMQERHDLMTSGGLTVLHNSPRQILEAGPRVLEQVEACYVRLRGRGLPPGVKVLSTSPERSDLVPMAV